MSPPPQHKATCLCGAIALTITAAPLAVAACYCGDCRKGAGGTHQVMATFPKHALQTTTTPLPPRSNNNAISTYTLTNTASGKPKTKTFCSTCGVPLWTETAAGRDEGVVYVRTAILEGWQELNPTSTIFTHQKPDWAPDYPGANGGGPA